MVLELAAPIGQVQQVMADIDSWPRWHPLLDAVEGELVVVAASVVLVVVSNHR